MPPVRPALAAVLKAAANQPPWDPPRATDLGPSIASERQEGVYHPRFDVVEAILAPRTPDARGRMLQARLVWLRGRKAAAEAALTAIGVAPELPAQLALSEVGAGDWPLRGTGIRVRRLWFRLRAGQRLRNRAENTDSDLALAALSDATVVPAAAAAADTATALLLQMRCLADVYARWEIGARLAAELAAAQRATPPLSRRELLARILAYGRIEGDLSVPPEDDTLEGVDPGSGPDDVPLPPGRTRFEPYLSPSAYLDCVTYLVSTAKVPDAATRRGNAEGAFAVCLGGLDILWSAEKQLAAEALFPTTPPFTRTDELDWPALNRQVPPSRSHDDAHADAERDLTTRLGLLTQRLKGTGEDEADRIAPLGVRSDRGAYSGAGAAYAASLLAEGVRYLDRLAYGPTRFGPGAQGRLPEIIVYALFHLGHEAAAMLASAAAHALLPRSTSSYAQALRSALGRLDAQTADALTAVRKASTANAVAVGVKHWPTIAAALRPAPVMAALADYLRHEDDSVWTSWVAGESSPRGNIIGYAQLYDYLLHQVGGV